MSIFEGKVALVTGGSTGIGRATALDFAEKGAYVVVADVNAEEAKKTVELIKAARGEAFFIQADVSKALDCKNMVAKTVEVYERLDYACNNAGIEGVSANIADMKPEDWQRVINVNLTGVFLSMKYEIPEMLKQHGGVIVNMASILGQVGFPNAGAYTAAKHGIVGLTKVAALEYSALGIRVNAVCPAFIETPMLERAGLLGNKAVRKSIEDLHPIGRLGRTEEIAHAVTFLCSPDASFISGESMLVDGAYVAGSIPRITAQPTQTSQQPEKESTYR
jgi:NAD(P)-dependent dehydrogenase (short-subunit alcohol dehydrogenase family)